MSAVLVTRSFFPGFKIHVLVLLSYPSLELAIIGGICVSQTTLVVRFMNLCFSALVDWFSCMLNSFVRRTHVFYMYKDTINILLLHSCINVISLYKISRYYWPRCHLFQYIETSLKYGGNITITELNSIPVYVQPTNMYQRTNPQCIYKFLGPVFQNGVRSGVSLNLTK